MSAINTDLTLKGTAGEQRNMCTNTDAHAHTRTHETWLAAVSIITQAAEHRCHFTICSDYLSPVHHPLLSPLCRKWKTIRGDDFSNWDATLENSLILIGVNHCCLGGIVSFVSFLLMWLFILGGFDWHNINMCRLSWSFLDRTHALLFPQTRIFGDFPQIPCHVLWIPKWNIICVLLSV